MKQDSVLEYYPRVPMFSNGCVERKDLSRSEKKKIFSFMDIKKLPFDNFTKEMWFAIIMSMISYWSKVRNENSCSTVHYLTAHDFNINVDARRKQILKHDT